MRIQKFIVLAAMAVAGSGLFATVSAPSMALAAARVSKPASAAPGRAIYVAQCASCHGDQGEGDGRAAVDFKVEPTDLTQPDVAGLSEGKLLKKLVHAPKPMPSFETLMSDAERREVVKYVRTLGGSSVAETE